MGASRSTAAELLNSWRSEHWPPKGMRRYHDLPIYLGDHLSVTALAESLSEVLALISDATVDGSKAAIPRWMALPKIEYLVERVNIVTAAAKASRHFESVKLLEKSCGKVLDEGTVKLQDWLNADPVNCLVAHKSFADLRAYVFTQHNDQPARHRFYQSGLVLAPVDGGEVYMQDNRRIIRSKRSDALKAPLAETGGGWHIFASTAGAQAANLT